ncbi:MAG TPA: YbaN family protein [Acidimicrobiia bacterium]|nr:YbaN family protein [Acidimicrobiia bacterium]
MSIAPRALPRHGPVARAGWLVGGLLAVAVGAVGIVVPGLPTTVFFIVAAWCFSHSSPRLERWVLNLPRVGPMVGDYRAGLGMPRRAKAIAISMIAVFVTLSVVLFIGSWPWRLVVLALGVVGVAYIAVRVPTRERVLEQR